METNEILEGNKLIAEFLYPNFRKDFRKAQENNDGIEIEGNMYAKICLVQEDYEYLKYHSSWDWLMSAIKKIGNDTEYELSFGFSYSYWNRYSKNPLNREFGGYGDIVAIFEAVIEFIRWHNLNK